MKNWIAVASAEHARRGRDGWQVEQGFMQVCHGKLAPGFHMRASAPIISLSHRNRC